MRSKIRRILTLSCTLLFCTLLISCKNTDGEIKKLKDLEFTVVENADLPEKLIAHIEERKANPFKFTYFNDDYLYIVQGYGAQKSGGYSISVDELFLADNAIYIKTNLIGPEKNEPVTPTVTYPYVVVKLEFIDKTVVFQ